MLKTITLVALVMIIVILPTAYSADIAIIDFADQWTQVAALGPCLDEYGYSYDDITKEVEGGTLKLDGYRLLFMSSMYTNNATLHQNVDKNANVIQDFVRIHYRTLFIRLC